MTEAQNAQYEQFGTDRLIVAATECRDAYAIEAPMLVAVLEFFVDGEASDFDYWIVFAVLLARYGFLDSSPVGALDVFIVILQLNCFLVLLNFAIIGKIGNFAMTEISKIYTMKKVLLTIFAFLCCFTASAVDFDVVVGGQLSHGPACRAGLDVSFPINNELAIMPGVYYETRNWSSTKTTESNSVKTETDFRINGSYVTVPVRVNYAIPLNNHDTMFLNMGLYGAYCLDGTYKYTVLKNNSDVVHKDSAFSAKAIDPRLDYGLTMGCSYLLKDHYIFTVYSEMGFRTIYHTDDLFAEIASSILPIDRLNLCLGFSFGYRF